MIYGAQGCFRNRFGKTQDVPTIDNGMENKNIPPTAPNSIFKHIFSSLLLVNVMFTFRGTEAVHFGYIGMVIILNARCNYGRLKHKAISH